MKILNLKNRKNDQGFTLIELLIVIIIIGILAAIAFVAYSGATQKANKADANSTLASVKSKLGEYNVDKGYFPAGTNDTSAVTAWLDDATGGNSHELATKYGGSGYDYSATPAGCDNSATKCTGFTLSADGETLGFDGTISMSN